MGYSCSAIAMDTVDALKAQLQEGEGKVAASNGWKKNGTEYFFEIGKEHSDGAVTGQVHRIKAGFCYPAGSFRIEPNGIIRRFPTSTKEQRTKAQEIARQKAKERKPLMQFI